MTPAYAAAISPQDQFFDPMNIRGKGTDVKTADELINENNVENSSNEMSNITGTLYTDEELSTANITYENSTNTIINTTEDSKIPETPNNEENSTEITEEPVCNLDNNTENPKPEVENETITAPVLNTTGIVMQTTNYTCGPAALATVLNNMGINATEHELAILAGTDENGTTMYGLIQAAKSKGLNAVGMKVSINYLKKNNIVFLTINGEAHYSVVREVTNDTVFIADPSLGNIAMTIDEFNNAYNGYALIINDFNNPENNISDILADDELQDINGMGYKVIKTTTNIYVPGYFSWKPGYFSWVSGRWSWQPGWWYWHHGYFYWVPGHWARWWIFWYWVPGYFAWHSGWWEWHSGYYYWIPGYWKWIPGYWVWNPGYWTTRTTIEVVHELNWDKVGKTYLGTGEVVFGTMGVIYGVISTAVDDNSGVTIGLAGLTIVNGVNNILSVNNQPTWVPVVE